MALLVGPPAERERRVLQTRDRVVATAGERRAFNGRAGYTSRNDGQTTNPAVVRNIPTFRADRNGLERARLSSGGRPKWTGSRPWEIVAREGMRKPADMNRGRKVSLENLQLVTVVRTISVPPHSARQTPYVLPDYGCCCPTRNERDKITADRSVESSP